ncbi:dihydroxyacetone kinase subunit DhaL [Oryzifoliimicrobium ureilyticus]|uniref:dihydroxyacetone kinase subunit DhaL n=1 Tax=Oryzifoliimicrobium ureilyticus TaxID=3113724 RepID=UPI0030764447
MKKLINSPSTVVRDMLEGIVALNPGVALLQDENIVVRSDLPAPAQRKVAVLSGGGSGHEPAHAGYVGAGMLSAAIAGDVFTSPSTDAVLAAIKAVSGPAGALLIVKNYTGDRLNFGLAAELARADGIPVELVIVADDVALRQTVDRNSRRGVAGTIFVHKVAGAAAEQGASLGEVVKVARDAAESLASMGISLGACTLPSVGKPGFDLGANEIEVGLGIHGEQGVRRMSIAPAHDLVRLVIEAIEADGQFGEGDGVALLVNGLGATPPMELSIIARSAMMILREKNFTVVRAWTGTFLSALDMPGFSLSLMKVDETVLNLIDTPTDALAWPRGGPVNQSPVHVNHATEAAQTAHDGANKITFAGAYAQRVARRAAQALIEAEARLTELDSVAGDGDLGASMRRGAEAILSLPSESFSDLSTSLTVIGNAVRKAIAGSSGPFYATALMRAARNLSATEEPTPHQLAEAFCAAVEAIGDLGGAKPGDRTMVDALYPAADTFRKKLREGVDAHEAWSAAIDAALTGAEATKTMNPRLGRASYLGERALGHADAGAVAVTIWLNAMRDID